MKSKIKIFCIGLNKTGTTSIHKALQMLGFDSVHHKESGGKSIKDIIYNNYKSNQDILKGIENYDAFSDWSHPSTNFLFKEFDKQYPNSKFILNTRDVDAWMNSREKHLKRTPNLKKLQKENPNNKWLKMDRTVWQDEFENHHKAVREYFADRPTDLLEFDVTKGDAWEKLCRFLYKDIPEEEFPSANVAANQSRKLKILAKVKRITKRFLKLGN